MSSTNKIRTFYSNKPNDKFFHEAVDVLENAGMIIFPTDTVYAIGCLSNQSKRLKDLAKIKGVKLEWVKLKLIDNSILELLKYHGDEKSFNKSIQKANKYGWSHISFTVKSIVDIINIINENGGKADNNFQYSPDGKVKVLYCNDIEGNILEIVEEI